MSELTFSRIVDLGQGPITEFYSDREDRRVRFNLPSLKYRIQTLERYQVDTTQEQIGLDALEKALRGGV